MRKAYQLYKLLEMNSLNKIKKIAFTGILAAVLCVIAPFSLPIGAIPISLATFVIYTTACSADLKYTASAVTVYILLGAAGLPVFSSFTGGFQIIAGLTGGYIIGYIPCVLIVGSMVKKYENKKIIYPLSMVLGTVACYTVGTAWYILQTGVNISSAILVCVVPFLLGDAVKIFTASIVGFTLRKRLKRFI